MNGSYGIGLALTLRDQATSGLQRYRDAVLDAHGANSKASESAKKSFNSLGQGAVVLGAGIGVLGGAFALANAAGPFTDALANLRAISGATAAQMEQLSAAAIDAGIATQFDPTQAAMALGDLAAAGFNVEESLSLLRPTLDLAAGSLGQLTPSDAAGLASQAMKAFGISTDDAGLAVDKMLSSVNVFALAAKDLPLALGTAARGAGTLNQSLDETLVTLGLVKNIVPGVERASTAVSTAMERMADPKVQTALKGLGVSAVDSTGKFRPFLDIVGDMIPELNKMTDAKRSAFLIDTFGTEALSGFNAIMTQVTTGIKTSAGETVRGADAIGYLRAQFQNAGGTAQKFSQELLKDMPGQLRLLQGSLSTLAIMLGQPLADAFRPVVVTLLSGLNLVLEKIRAMSPETKAFFARVVVAAGAILTLVGAVMSLQASFGLLSAGLRVAGLSFSALATSAGSALFVIGLLTAAALALKQAYDANLGGIADRFNEMARTVGLAWDALSQLFTQGGFSGAVREEMGKAENSGIRAFAIQVFLWVNRIKNFFMGLGAGFSAAIDAARPAFAAFGGALEQLGQAFGIVQDKPKEAGEAFDAFGGAGASVGAAIGKGLEIAVRVISSIMKLIAGAKSMFSFDSVTGPLSAAFSAVGDALSDVFNAITDVTASGSDRWTSFGKILGVVVVGALRTVVNIIQTVAGAIASVATIFTGMVNIIGGIVTGNWTRVWHGMAQVVFGVVNAIVDAVLGLVQGVAGALDTLSFLGGNKTNYAEQVSAFRDSTRKGLRDTFGLNQDVSPPEAASTAQALTPGAMTVASNATLATLSSGAGQNASIDPALIGKAAGEAAGREAARIVGNRPVVAEVNLSGMSTALTDYTTTEGALSFYGAAPDEG